MVSCWLGYCIYFKIYIEYQKYYQKNNRQYEIYIKIDLNVKNIE